MFRKDKEKLNYKHKRENRKVLDIAYIKKY